LRHDRKEGFRGSRNLSEKWPAEESRVAALAIRSKAAMFPKLLQTSDKGHEVYKGKERRDFTGDTTTFGW
jgi:hypothetical protein